MLIKKCVLLLSCSVITFHLQQTKFCSHRAVPEPEFLKDLTWDTGTS